MDASNPSQRQRQRQLNNMMEAIKCIEGQAAISSADHLVCSLLSVLSTSNFKLPSNVNKSLRELRKAIDDASICIEDDGDCEEMMENSNGDGDAFMSPAASSVDRPSKRHRSTDLCRTTCFPAEYDEGMLVHLNPLALPVSGKDVLLIGECSRVLPVLFFNIGQLQLKRRQHDAALRFFELADEILKNDECDDSCSDFKVTSQLAILHQVAYIHFRQHDYVSAMEALKEVSQISEQRYGRSHLSYASALHCIGTVMFHMRNSESQEILQVFERALYIRKLVLGSHHKDVATTLNNIGRVHFDCSDFKEALTYYDEALSIRQDVFGEDHKDVAATIFNIGQAHHRLDLVKEALEYYCKFYSYISRFGSLDQHRDEVVVLKHMAQVHHEQKNVAEARSCYQKAINVSVMLCGPQQEKETACILNMFGNMLYENGLFDKAAEIYEQGLVIERKVSEPCCVNIVITLSNIGQALMQQGNYRRALCPYIEAYAIQSLQPEKDIKKLTETLSIIGQISNLLGRHSEAVKAFQEVIAIRKAAFGDHVDVALALNYLGLLYFKKGALDLAMENFEESLRVRRKCAPNATCGDIAVLSYNIGSIHLHRGDNENALKCYQDALDVERATYGHVHQDVAVTLKLMGKVYDKCGNYEEASRYYTEALDIYKKCAEVAEESSETTTTESSRKNSLDAARLLALLASVNLRQG